MRLKLLMVLISIVLIVLPLSASCSSSTSPTTAVPAQTTATPAQTTAAPAQTTTATTAAPSTAGTVYKLKWSTSFQLPEPPGAYATHFLDAIEKNSNGQVIFERFPGGVLGTAAEQLKLASTGSVDLVSIVPFNYPADMPLHAYPNFQLSNNVKVVEFNNKLRYEIPETSAILEQEETENNVKFLNYMASGGNGIISKIPFTSVKELKGKKIGSNMPMKQFEQFGLTISTMTFAEIYEALSRGVVDCVTLAIGPMVALKWYEPCKTYMSSYDYAAGQCLVINLDTWNKLPADIQKIFTDAAAETTQFSIEYDTQNTAKNLDIFKNAGLTTGVIPLDEAQLLFQGYQDYRFNEQMFPAAAKKNKTTEAEVIKKVLLELSAQ